MDFLEKFNMLPENVKAYFSSKGSRIDLERACFLYDINEDDIEKMVLPIRDIFLKETSLDQLPFAIQKALHISNTNIANGIAYELSKKSFCPLGDYFPDAQDLLKKWEQDKIPPIISEEKAQRRVLDIEPWILEEEKEKKAQEAAAQKRLDNIELSKALEKYPKLGEQGVTTNPLKLKYFESPVRPSIKNWITDFHDNMGAGKHGAMDRGNYLFHGENGKKLTSFERQKISSILRSLDENSPITIDPEKQLVVFENNENEQRPAGNIQPVSQRFVPIQQDVLSNRQTINDMRRPADNIQLASQRLVSVQKDISSSRQPITDMQRPAYNNNEQSRQRIPAVNAQEDIFQRYTPDAIEQEKKQKQSFLQKIFSKDDVQSAKPTVWVENKQRDPIPSSQAEKFPEKRVVSPVPDNEQKKYFQRPVQKLTTNTTLGSDNYFSNFNSGTENQSLHAAAPKNTDVAPIQAKKEDVASPSGNMSFSSSQKFSTEKKTMRESPWHIRPVEGFEEVDDIGDKNDQASKNSKNIVNLKN